MMRNSRKAQERNELHTSERRLKLKGPTVSTTVLGILSKFLTYRYVFRG